MPESAGVVPEHAPETTAPPAAVIDVSHEGHMLNTPLLVGVLFVALIVTIVVVILTLSFMPAWLQRPTCAGAIISITILVFASILRFQKTDLRDLRTRMDANRAAPIAERVKAALSITHSIWPQKITRELSQVLAEQGAIDVTVRIAPPDDPTTISPIAVPFEPHRPDELTDLVESTAQDTNDAPATPRKPPPRGIRRNVILKGGWVLVGIYGVVWTFSAIEAIRRAAVTPRFMLWTLVLLTFILFPVGSSWLGGGQWLAVPRGLIVRKSSMFRRGWKSHIFERGKAVIVLYRLYRRQWVLIAADGEACESTIGTRAELECALAAWLSPVPPPTREELADWL